MDPLLTDFPPEETSPLPTAEATAEEAEDALPGDGESAEEAPRRRLRLPQWLKSRDNAPRAVFLLGPWLTYLMVVYLNNNDPFNALNPTQVTLNLVW